MLHHTVSHKSKIPTASISPKLPNADIGNVVKIDQFSAADISLDLLLLLNGWLTKASWGKCLRKVVKGIPWGESLFTGECSSSKSVESSFMCLF